MELNKLETAILDIFRDRYSDYGFPDPIIVSVIDRIISAAGAKTKIAHENSMDSPDGILYMGNYSHIELSGVSSGATVSVEIENGKAVTIDIVINGGENWDGDVSNWRIFDPENGESYVKFWDGENSQQ